MESTLKDQKNNNLDDTTVDLQQTPNSLEDKTDELHQPLDFTSAFTTDKVFSSKGSLITWAREVGKEHGFVVVIKGSESGGGRRKPRIRLACERGGIYRESKYKPSRQFKQRKGAGTKKCGCPFQVHGVKLDNDDEWCVKVVSGLHNHLPIKQLEGHSYAGRLSDQEKTIVSNMTKGMVKPKEILMTIKQHDEKNETTMKTIYNARHRYKFIEKASRSQMQQLVKQLKECNYVEWHRSKESTDSVRDLFWAHPASVDLLRAFPSVLLIDSTCKTNRYCLPLLEIVGVTSTDLTFSIAFEYLEAELEESYNWAMKKLKCLISSDIVPSVIVTERDFALMNAVRKVFPSTTSLLCRCHISKDVLGNCRKFFERKEKWEAFMSAWSVLVYSSNKDEYQRNLNLLGIDYQTYPRALEYVIDVWLSRHKERFVAVWTDKIMHFGNVAANRAEGAHAKLKRHLGSLNGDFETSWNFVNNLIELQHNEIKASFQKSITAVEYNPNPVLFKELHGFVSRSALNMILLEAKRADQVGTNKQDCVCVIRGTHGLPCAHEISELMRDGRPIPLSILHFHWIKLDLTSGKVKGAVSELTIDTELESIAKRFSSCDEAGKLALKRKLRELGDLTASLQPLEKSKTKGYPKSTANDISRVEVVESCHDSMSAATTSSVQVWNRDKLPIHRTKTVPGASNT